MLVIDDVDEIVKSGQAQKVREIVEQHAMPGRHTRQTLISTSDLSQEACRRLCEDYLHDYIWVCCADGTSSLALWDSFSEKMERCRPRDKFDLLLRVRFVCSACS